MTVENTVQWMLDLYSDLYPTRKHCLDQLFCVIGNGYKWVDGELVETGDELLKRYKMTQKIKHAKGKFEDLWNVTSQQQLRLKQLIPDYKLDPKYTFRWYPLSKDHSYLYNYPENIKPDWKAAIEECKQLLIQDGVEV